MVGSWIDPALVPAVIAGLVSVAGRFVTARQPSVPERVKRTHKIRDVQIAFRAEIGSGPPDLQAFALEQKFARIEAQYEVDPACSTFLPNAARHAMLEPMVPDI